MECKVSLSVAIIVKNEEEMLPNCLQSISFADDIVVVDSGSTDRTVEIATKFGCRVFIEEWKGYGQQKNSAVEKCKHDWVLIIDADERIPEETKNEIIKVISSQDVADAYSFRRKNFFRGRWIKHCGWWPDRQIRLVRKTNGRFESLVHERWINTKAVKDLDVWIKHYSFKNYSEMIKKLDEYSDLSAKELYKRGVKANVFTPLLHGISMFLRSYIINRGFLEGFDGFIIALAKAGGSFLKYAKLLELQRYKNGSPV